MKVNYNRVRVKRYIFYIYILYVVIYGLGFRILLFYMKSNLYILINLNMLERDDE